MGCHSTQATRAQNACRGFVTWRANSARPALRPQRHPPPQPSSFGHPLDGFARPRGVSRFLTAALNRQTAGRTRPPLGLRVRSSNAPVASFARQRLPVKFVPQVRALLFVASKLRFDVRGNPSSLRTDLGKRVTRNERYQRPRLRVRAARERAAGTAMDGCGQLGN